MLELIDFKWNLEWEAQAALHKVKTWHGDPMSFRSDSMKFRLLVLHYFIDDGEPDLWHQRCPSPELDTSDLVMDKSVLEEIESWFSA